MTKGSDREARLRDLAAELEFDLSEETVEAVLVAADDLRTAVEDLSDPVEARPASASVGSRSTDEYDALLDVYDEPRVRGDGALSGVSVAFKDVIAVADLKLTAGSKSLSYVPSFDATVVDRLLDAGASVVGKANHDAFAFGPTGEFSEFGSVVNPAAPDRVPGGSSSGSGAAVAGGLVDATLGTDTGGSIRIPAACCGVVGVKPTHGRVSQHGVGGLAPSADTTGPLAPDVETAAAVLEVIAGYDPHDPTSSMVKTDPLAGHLDPPADLHVGMPTAFFEATDDDLRSVVEGVADDLAAAGADVETVPFDLGNVDRVYSLVIASEFAWLCRSGFLTRGQGPDHGAEWRTGLSSARFNDHVAERVLPAALVDDEYNGRGYATGRDEALALRERFVDTFDRVDVLLTPTLRVLPPKLGTVSSDELAMMGLVGNTEPLNVTGLPGVSVPVGDVDGVPVGAQLVAPWFEERLALRAAKLVESMADAQ